MDEFLTKPIQTNALWAAIERVTEWHAAQALVDTHALFAACDGDAGVFERIRMALFSAVPIELRSAQACLQANDLPALREIAHRLHGMLSAASSKVGNTASELEDEAARGASEPARAVFARLATLAPRLLEELRRITVSDLELLR